jgi:hypothetical protein
MEPPHGGKANANPFVLRAPVVEDGRAGADPLLLGGKRRSRLPYWLIVLAVIAATVAAFLLTLHLVDWTEDGLRQAIAADLPPGSTRAQVNAWLAAHHFAQTALTDPPALYAVSPPNVQVWLERDDFEVYFYFDEDDQLDHFEVKARSFPF